MLITPSQLKVLLVGANLITADKFELIKKDAETDKKPIEEVLVNQNVISDIHLGQILANYLQVPFVDLTKIEIPLKTLGIIPEIMAKNQKAVVFFVDESELKLGMADPGRTELPEMIAKKTGLKIIPHLATLRGIEASLRLYQKELQLSFDELLKNTIYLAGKTSVSEAPVAKIVELLIQYAQQDKASDIHIEPEEQESLIRFRIDGMLHDVLRLPRQLHDQVITRIKVLSKLRTDEHLSAQDGKMQQKFENEKLDIRVSIVPVTEGEKAVLRLLSSYSREIGLANLGMNNKDMEKVKSGFNKPYGMVIATGPTGSGKTTTIYSIIKILNTRERNIASIEDPVEYEIEGINQIQVNPKTNLTFAEGLRSILRQDPDIVFVGEIRDRETAGIAINSAMTGHLVLSTLHTNDAATSLPRFIDMGIEPFLVASTVNVIIGQRMVRKICENCRVSYEIQINGENKTETENNTNDDPGIKKLNNLNKEFKQLSKELVDKYFGVKDIIRLYRGQGCPVCHQTGYSGRIGIFEILEVTESIRDLIIAKADSTLIAKKAVEEGMSTMTEDGLNKVKQGVTTIEEVIRVTKE